MLASTITHYGLAISLVLINTGWLALVFFGLPGTWLMVLSTAIVAWMQWQPGASVSNQPISLWTLLVLVALAVVGEILEFVAGAAGAKRAGGSTRGALAAIVGGLVGAIVGTFMIPIPLLGSLLGAAGGAGLAAWTAELTSGKSHETALRIGWGAGVGRLMGTLYKFIVGTVIWLVAAVAVFWP